MELNGVNLTVTTSEEVVALYQNLQKLNDILQEKERLQSQAFL